MRPNELRNFFNKYSEVLKDRYDITELNVNDWRHVNDTYYEGESWSLYSLVFDYDYNCVWLDDEDGGLITAFDWRDSDE